MAGSMNKVILIGRIGQDPKLSYTPSGQAVVNFSLATDEGYKDRNTGQRVDRTEWHRIVAWRQTAEFVGKYLTKGNLVLVEGKLQTRKWADQNGQDRFTTEIVANTVQGLESRQQPGQYQPQQGGRPNQGYNNNQQNNQPQGGYDNQQGGGYPDDEDLGPAFPSEASGMDEVPF